MRIARQRWWRTLAAMTALAMLAVACGNGDADPADDDGASDDEAADEGDVPEGGEEGSISILHAQTGETDTAGLRAAMAAFTEETGIEVQESGTSDFEQLALTRVQGGNPPDILMHPQPGLMYDLIDQGLAFPQDDVLDVDALRSDMVDGLVELGERDGEFYGMMVRLSIKSLVWYVPERFEAGGYEIPETWEQMVDLGDQMVADGQTPWCIGIESSDATGWVATDWMEDIMLRLHGADAYDDWITNDLKFNSPEVTQVVEEYMDPIWFGEGQVFGGPPNILQTSFGDSPLGLFDDNCMMHRQASFISGFFPEDVTVGEDVDFFYLPEIAASGEGAPVLIAGDLAAAYTDNPSVADFFEFFATPASGEPWGAEGAWLSPFKDFDTSTYADESLAAQGEIISNADFARFDGSDMMPGAVGAGSFWTEMVNYISRGGEDLEGALQTIDDSWPS
ncbi:MAG: extracellular solute-binding protein [Intrasporangiaceae bacterium]|nr:extracellular solute-binding protein [Intrasporangiaceae bacterium]